MDRRIFLKNSFLTCGALALPIGGHAAEAGGEKSDGKFQVRYIREKIPPFEIPPYRGHTYEDKVPDTLDIAERAKLGINCLTSVTDDRTDYEIYWIADFHRNPPVMTHDFGDWCRNVEGMMESLALLRAATGSTVNNQVDSVWMASLLKSIGPDGLLYIPLEGTPWSRVGTSWIQPIWRANGTTTDPSDKSLTQVTSPCAWPRAMAAMTLYYLRDQNPMWKQTIERMVQRMSMIATDEGRYAYFPAGGYEPNVTFGSSAGEQEMPTGYLAVDGGNGRLIQGLAQYYRATGYEPARELAGKLVKFLRRRADYYDDEGRFVICRFERYVAKVLDTQNYPHLNVEGVDALNFGGHFHNHTTGLLSLAEYAGTVRDRELLAWCKSSYEWAKTQGSSLVGFFPEMIIPGYPSCESCEVADMIGIATKLSAAGAADYWDDIDRWARNQFAENQLTESEWVYRLAESQPKRPVAYNETADRVAERNVGGFAGWASGNEFGLVAGVPQCCTGNSTRALYYIWEHIVESQEGKLQVNLLLNRASAWADVYSYIPYQGRVDVKIKKDCPVVRVRVPEWVEGRSPQVVCRVNGATREVVWEGRYVNVGAGQVGETLSLSFPIATRRVRESMGGVSYTLDLRGNTVVSVDPAGKSGPLYQRSHYLAEQAPFRTVERFVPEEPIAW